MYVQCTAGPPTSINRQTNKMPFRWKRTKKYKEWRVILPFYSLLTVSFVAVKIKHIKFWSLPIKDFGRYDQNSIDH